MSSDRGFRARAAVAGVLAVGAGIGVGEIVASAVGVQGPVVATAQAAIDRAPAALREWAIRTFGESDKGALVVGVGIVLLAAAVLVGAMAPRRPDTAVVAIIAVALLGALAAAAGRPPGTAVERSVPAVVAGAVAVACLLALRATARDGSADSAADAVLDRRRFLSAAAAVAAVGVGGGVIGYQRSSPSVATGLSVPMPAERAAPVPAGASFDGAGLSPYFTPNRAFYRVDTAAALPRVDLDDWGLRVHGMVDRELTLSYDDLVRRRLIERDVTLTCVSNEVGGPYVGNARWIGLPVRDLLDEAGVRAGADAVKSTSYDGFTVGTPLGALTDDRDAMIAIAMNGEPLPLAHGFPARLVTPGLYGFVGATKWLTDLEVTRFADFTAYWTERGWAERAPIRTASRIDHPRQGAYVSVGPITIAGVAWAQRRGIAAVDIRIDDGPWIAAELAAETGVDTWRQWRFDWDAPIGKHVLTVRATDRTGEVQTPERRPPVPDGASGWHAITVFVYDGVPTGPLTDG
jgi:DMSO/TMAO reductase YedYZ molybdopterin-dependent catalytic subunit